ncbi:hypothetical protein V6N13_007823 [Hibiscus sabdariffa]
MHFPLSWRWPRWCTLRIPLGAALWFSVPRGGTSLVRLASSMRDCIGSPRPRPCLEGTLHVARPLVGFGIKYTGLAPRPCCLARPVHWQPCLHRLGVCWKQPWPPFASVWPNASIACSNPSLLLGNRPTLSANPRLRPPGCALHSTHGAFVPRLRCPSHRLAACPVRAFPWPSDGQKLQYGAWMRAPQPKRPVASRPRGRVSLVVDVVDAMATAPSAASGLPIEGASAPVTSPASDTVTPHAAAVNPTAPITSSAPLARPSPLAPTSSAPASADHEHDPYDPTVHSATSDMLEDALAIPADCALLVDIDGIIQSNGEDLVHGAIGKAADSLIRDVAASVLGYTPLSVDTDATVASVTSVALSTTSPTAPGLSRSTPACARRLPMPALLEHQEFDA